MGLYFFGWPTSSKAGKFDFGETDPRNRPSKQTGLGTSFWDTPIFTCALQEQALLPPDRGNQEDCRCLMIVLWDILRILYDFVIFCENVETSNSLTWSCWNSPINFTQQHNVWSPFFCSQFLRLDTVGGLITLVLYVGLKVFNKRDNWNLKQLLQGQPGLLTTYLG